MTPYHTNANGEKIAAWLRRNLHRLPPEMRLVATQILRQKEIGANTARKGGRQ